MEQSYCERLQINWQVSSGVNRQMDHCFRCRIRGWGFSRRGCRPVGVKNVIWGVYFIWVASTYFSRWQRGTIKIKVLNFVNNINIIIYKKFIEKICKTLSRMHNICVKWVCIYDATFTSEKYVSIQIESSIIKLKLNM